MKLGILGTGMIVKDVLTMYHELGVEKTYLFSTKKSTFLIKLIITHQYSMNKNFQGLLVHLYNLLQNEVKLCN